MKFTGSKEKCTGCFACYNICSQGCIDMIEDDLGFIYPVMDESRCINCGLCKEVCTIHGNVEYKTPIGAFAAWNKDESMRKASASGGVATTISSYIISNNGSVYGAVYTGSGVVEHVRADKKEDLCKLQGSKYVHSYVKETYRAVKRELLLDKTVAYFGTPCQIAGLKLYLKKDYPKLYLVDLICHGVPSQRFLAEEIRYWTDEAIDGISFRGTDGFRLKLYRGKELIKNIPMEDSTYYKAFIDSVTYRECCYNCRFAKQERCSDITLGDYWGIGDKDGCSYKDQIDLGISVVIPVTEKGMKLLTEVENDLFIERRKLSEAVKGNTQLRKASRRRKYVSAFRKKYPRLGFKTAVEEALKGVAARQGLKNSLKGNRLFCSLINIVKD